MLLMNNKAVENINIEAPEILITPSELKKEIPISVTARNTLADGRKAIENILERKDHRIFVVVGPCSIHDLKAAHEYAAKLKELAEKVSDTLLIVMRVYFEKPRTTTGWKGLINDPFMNDSFKITDGLRIGRQLLHDILELGLPTATEALDPISPQYMQDLITWSAIGARTTESQTHREMASGLSSSVGFKNGTDRFLGINSDGKVSVITTKGNPYAHVVLRGGNGKPNYDSVSVSICEQELEDAGVTPNIMVDCSHANSNKDHNLQPLVLDNVANQILEGNTSIVGAMIESHLSGGNQKLSSNPDDLEYGVSVTDACVDWKTTESSILAMADKLRQALKTR
jgi:3-deoxy-7-phosphoheptulonate synthase